MVADRTQGIQSQLQRTLKQYFHKPYIAMMDAQKSKQTVAGGERSIDIKHRNHASIVDRSLRD